MIRRLPEWWTKVKEEIEGSISEQAQELNIPVQFVWDSKGINDCVCGIMNILLRLKEEVKGEFDEEQIKQFKKIKEAIKKEDSEKEKDSKEKESIKSTKEK